MELARVVGSVVSTAKVDRLIGHKLLVVNLLGPDLKATSNFVVAVDPVGAGKDEVVIVVRGSSARQAESLAQVPTDTSIIAIVDSVELQGKTVFNKADEVS